MKDKKSEILLSIPSEANPAEEPLPELENNKSISGFHKENEEINLNESSTLSHSLDNTITTDYNENNKIIIYHTKKNNTNKENRGIESSIEQVIYNTTIEHLVLLMLNPLTSWFWGPSVYFLS